MKKLELRNEQSFVFAALVQSIKMNEPTIVDGVELQSCAITYLVTRGTSYVTNAVGSEAVQYGTATTNVLLSSRNKTVQVPRYANGQQVFNGIDPVFDERSIMYFVGKVCLISGAVGYFADTKSEIYKPVLRLRSIAIYVKDDMKALVSKEVKTNILPSFADEQTALSLLKPAQEKGKQETKTEPTKTVWEVLGKSEKEWSELDKEAQQSAIDEHISAKQIKDPIFVQSLYNQVV